MWLLRTWFHSGLGGVRFTVGINDLKGLFQPQCFFDSSNLKDITNMEALNTLVPVSFTPVYLFPSDTPVSPCHSFSLHPAPQILLVGR